MFYNLWRKRETLELKYSLLTYLSVAVKYQILDLLDKKHRRLQAVSASDLESDLEIGLSPSADDALLEKELFERLEQTATPSPMLPMMMPGVSVSCYIAE
ncbi:hypothetical protein [Pedobacter sp.]|uniref:hypothetical protein n=1 Tax=Pedobacter sp. TaxID=1411316 RepID=UPI003D7FD0E5